MVVLYVYLQSYRKLEHCYEYVFAWTCVHVRDRVRKRDWKGCMERAELLFRDNTSTNPIHNLTQADISKGTWLIWSTVNYSRCICGMWLHFSAKWERESESWRKPWANLLKLLSSSLVPSMVPSAWSCKWKPWRLYSFVTIPFSWGSRDRERERESVWEALV